MHSTDPLQTRIYIFLQKLTCNWKNNSPYREPWKMFFLNFFALSVKNQLSIPAHINFQMLHLKRTPSNVNLWTLPQTGSIGWRFHYISIWINQITSLSEQSYTHNFTCKLHITQWFNIPAIILTLNTILYLNVRHQVILQWIGPHVIFYDLVMKQSK